MRLDRSNTEDEGLGSYGGALKGSQVRVHGVTAAAAAALAVRTTVTVSTTTRHFSFSFGDITMRRFADKQI